MALPTKKQARKLQRKGRKGDSLLAHINPHEAKILKALGGSGTQNPETGLLEFYADSDPAGSDPGSGMGGGDPLGHDATDSNSGGGASDPDREGLGGGPGAPSSNASPATAGDLGFDPSRGQPTFSAEGMDRTTFEGSPLDLGQERDLTMAALTGMVPGLGLLGKAVGSLRSYAEREGMEVSDDHSVGRDQGSMGGAGDTANKMGGAADKPAGALSPTDLLLATAGYPQRNLVNFGGDPYTYGFGQQEHAFFQPNPAPAQYAMGGPVTGPGGGVDDAIPAVVDGAQPARISSGEYVVPAAAVAALGDGSSEQGSRKMKALIEMIMKEKYGKSELPRLRSGLQTLLQSVR